MSPYNIAYVIKILFTVIIRYIMKSMHLYILDSTYSYDSIHILHFYRQQPQIQNTYTKKQIHNHNGLYICYLVIVYYSTLPPRYASITLGS